MKLSRSCLLILLTLILMFAFVTSVSAEYTYVQNDADNPTKFSIDKKIADGFATDDLYVGTTEAYLGAKADGKTPIFQEGLAIHPADILITNGQVGVVLAIGTADPWGYPGGSILDAGRVNMPESSNDWQKATFGKDTVLTCQFLFNNWDAWAPVNAGMVYCDLVKYNFDTKEEDNTNGIWAVKINRAFKVSDNNNGSIIQRNFDVISYYSVEPGVDYVNMFDTVHNRGDAAVTRAHKNQLSLSNKGGDGIDSDVVAALSAAGTYNWVADENGNPERSFYTTLITPGENPGSDGSTHPFTGFSGAVGYREFNFADMDYEVGESRIYESYLMIDDECSWQKVYDFWADYKGYETFNISGTVKDVNGQSTKYPVVLVYRGSTLYGWVMGDENGNYSVDLPNENTTQTYNLRVELSDTITGTPSANFTSSADGTTIDLIAGAYKVPVTFNFEDAETGDPVWGRVIVGNIPIAAFTGKNYFFSDNSEAGTVEKSIGGPGTKEVIKGTVTAMVDPTKNYSATCYGEGYNFSSVVEGTSSGSVTVSGNPLEDTNKTVEVDFVHPTPENWFSIDNHHHGQRMDAFSPPEVVAKAQVTAGLDVLTLDDHEFVLDNWPVYLWGQKMDITGYMPSEEVTASWAHFDIMPLTVDCYEQYLDRDQKNEVVNTNQSLRGIIDQGHLFGASIGAMHPTSSYGMLLADNNDTVPGGLIDDFDGLEAQFSKSHTNDTIAYWNAYVRGESHRNVPVKRPHYIWASTDIHQSGTSAGSGSRRSYVFLEDGETLSETDFDRFGLEFARSEALGRSFNSSGVYILPDSEGLMYGGTYWADEEGNFTAKFDISAIQNIKEVYVFSSLSDTVAASGEFKDFNSCLSHTTYSGADLTNDLQDFTVELEGVEGRQWIALAASSSNNQYALTNPIWVNGPDVDTETITEVSFQNPPALPAKLNDGQTVNAPTSAGILITEPWSVRMVEDWDIEGIEFGETAVSGETYTYSFTFTAPEGYVFAQSLTDAEAGFAVSEDGATLVYSQTREVVGDDNTTVADITVTLNEEDVATINPTQEQWDKWLGAEKPNLLFDFRDEAGLQDMKGAQLIVDPTLLGNTNTQIILPDGSGITVPKEIWETIATAADDGPVELSIVFKDGKLELTLTQNGETLELPGNTQSILIQIPYSLSSAASSGAAVSADAEDPNYIVAKCGNEVIARSWFDSDKSVVFARVYDVGEYTAAYVPTVSFDDTKGKWMDAAVKYLRARDVAYGIGNNLYAADRNITRADFTSLFMRTLRLKDNGKDPVVFKDAAQIPAYAKDLINMASAYELVYGVPVSGSSNEVNFMSNANISRQDAFEIVYRGMGKIGILPETIPNNNVSFKDGDTIASYAKDGVMALANLGLVQGHDTGYVKPYDNMTRAECAQFLYSFLSSDS